MSRRLHVSELRLGDVPLPADEAHHARRVLRLSEGVEVELFDDGGMTARGVLSFEGARGAVVKVELISKPERRGPVLTVASAIPKGDRADWMIEKLAELGVDRFIPLAAARSVVLPEGKGKTGRWARLATEASKQSRRVGIMQIGRLSPVLEVLKESVDRKWVLSTEAEAKPAIRVIGEQLEGLTVFVGPEGGWTDEELAVFAFAKASAVRLTESVLRIETAAVAGAALARTLMG